MVHRVLRSCSTLGAGVGIRAWPVRSRRRSFQAVL